ncbi:glutamine--tRNA ligase [Candidatus Ishikawella capsulata]|uniref:Glutamine--tRNA ligase n=1 Tax=Candidatus Ishikawaella capsulata Mpkobe TaxID=476281 RepID=C5WDD9_9ENTR|nr:glutamine--tRNA ligase [Candidatus Ishikawaella capsulata]BAH83345.1 glutaminyl-tRNA synthetase [Candidatus Ishikawaella capsulata Mpkobe]
MKQTTTQNANFIRQIITADLVSGKCTKVHTRFPPEPNGYLHIGHAKSICLNFGIAKDYHGECNLRFDDTNPGNESKDFVEAIKYDIHWLGFDWTGDVRYSSDYFNKMYQYAIQLIYQGLAYVDELSTEQIREYRGTLNVSGKNSPFRNRSAHENFLLFEKMRNGDFLEGQACLRAKIDMSSSFIVMRDPVLYRIKYVAHHQTGHKWYIYPMYDFAHCISDALEGITHSLCTLEFQDNRRLYDWILNHINIKHHPHQYEFSRLNLEYSITSKRKMTQLINEKIVDGWDDPRLVTISGLRRRGYTPRSIREFCQLIGVTKQENTISMSLLESCIRNDLNNNAPRLMAVINPLKLIIENLPDNYEEIIIAPNHPNNPDMGTRNLFFSREIWIDRTDFREQANKNYKRLTLGHEVRLRYAYIVRAKSVLKDTSGNINCIYCTADLDTLGKTVKNRPKVKGVIHWVSAIHGIAAEFREYNSLFINPNPGCIEDLTSIINKNSLEIKHGFIEPHLTISEVIQNYQFEREGYFCTDYIHSSPSRLVFNKTVGLRNINENKFQ